MTERVRNQGWIAQYLSAVEFVEWDRFTVGDWGDEQSVSVYGWIDREDEYKDFVLMLFWPESETLYYITSSDEYTAEIHQRVFDESPEKHNDCRRVEHTFEVPNAIELGQQQTLTDGGQSLASNLYTGTYKQQCRACEREFTAAGSYCPYCGTAANTPAEAPEASR